MYFLLKTKCVGSLAELQGTVSAASKYEEIM